MAVLLNIHESSEFLSRSVLWATYSGRHGGKKRVCCKGQFLNWNEVVNWKCWDNGGLSSPGIADGWSLRRHRLGCICSTAEIKHPKGWLHQGSGRQVQVLLIQSSLFFPIRITQHHLYALIRNPLQPARVFPPISVRFRTVSLLTISHYLLYSSLWNGVITWM